MNTNANTIPTVTKARGPYGPRNPKAIAKDESESQPAVYPEPDEVEVVVVEEQEGSGTEDADEDCDDCPNCGKGLTDLCHKRDKGYVGDMICDSCYEDDDECLGSIQDARR
jgi:hypothetical protein